MRPAENKIGYLLRSQDSVAEAKRFQFSVLQLDHHQETIDLQTRLSILLKQEIRIWELGKFDNYQTPITLLGYGHLDSLSDLPIKGKIVDAFWPPHPITPFAREARASPEPLPI